MKLDGLIADAEPLPDPLVGQTLGEQLEHLHLAGGERLDDFFLVVGGRRHEDGIGVDPSRARRAERRELRDDLDGGAVEARVLPRR